MSDKENEKEHSNESDNSSNDDAPPPTVEYHTYSEYNDKVVDIPTPTDDD